MKLWQKLILWLLLWIPIGIFLPSNPHFPVALIAPYFGFFGFLDADAWHGGLFFEITLPWLAFWSVFIAIIDIHLAKKKDDTKIFKMKKRQFFWLVVALTLGLSALFIGHEKESSPEEDCLDLNGRFDAQKQVCEYPH